MSRIYGTNYNSELSTKDVAKQLRKDFKSILPKEIKLSITTDIYSGGSAIRVEIKTFPYYIYKTVIDDGYEETRLTNSAIFIEQLIRDYINTYNYDGSDSMTDYCDVNFHTSVSFDYELTNNMDILNISEESLQIEIEDLENLEKSINM